MSLAAAPPACAARGKRPVSPPTNASLCPMCTPVLALKFSQPRCAYLIGPPFGFPTRTAVVTDLSYAFCSRKTPSRLVSWSRASLSRSCDRRPPPASASPPEPEDTAERIRADERSMHRSHAARRSAPSNVGSEAGQVHGLPNASHEPTPNVSSAHVRAKAPRRTRCRRRRGSTSSAVRWQRGT